MAKIDPKPTEQANQLLRLTASQHYDVAMKAMKALAEGLEEPLRQGLLESDTLGDIYRQVDLAPGAEAKFPLDFVAPGTEKDFVAFTLPKQARVPERHIEGDEVWVPTFRVANAVDWSLSYARDARWDVVARANEIFAQGIAERGNDDGWHVVMASAASRGIVVTDPAAAAGAFTKKLINRMKTVNKRTAPGAGINLTDMYMSPEGFEDLRDWDIDDVDELTRREIFVSEDDKGLVRIYGVNLHELKKLGVSQDYQDFIITTLGVALPGTDEEFVIGVDLSRRDSFVQPIRQRLSVFEDPMLHRMQKAGIYGFAEWGYGALDNRRAMLASY
jgi:hypothetical protein